MSTPSVNGIVIRSLGSGNSPPAVFLTQASTPLASEDAADRRSGLLRPKPKLSHEALFFEQAKTFLSTNSNLFLRQENSRVAALQVCGLATDGPCSTGLRWPRPEQECCSSGSPHLRSPP